MPAFEKKRKVYSNAEAVDILHQVSTLYTLTKRPHDYGTGEVYTATEVHTLKRIADNPGITVTQLAGDSGRTKGAISQMLKKLEGKGLIFRRADPQNDNIAHLYPTEEGYRLNDVHQQYDSVRFGESMDQVRKVYTNEEIDTTFSVLETWLNIRRQVQQKRNEQKQSKKG